ncbi:hypothetical protein AAVH_28583 [Aphelenchoides avenae]|nr:hypothetical protein AAVH_28583 [Aphelenchus avenae]
MCQLPIPAQFLQFGPTFGMPSEIAWACRHPETCCGLRCCKQATKTVLETSLRSAWIAPVCIVAVIALSLGIYLLHRLEKKRAFIRESRRLAANKEAAKRPPAYTCYKTVYATLPHDPATALRLYAEQARFLPPPPLPLSADVDPCHFAPAFNSDFRAEVDSGRFFFRGGARYIRPSGVFRYALAVVGKYPGQDEWLRRDGGEGEWQVAYHGTACENISNIIRDGFDIERCQRFTYGKGIYCSPDPRVARNYSKPYESQGRWYKAVLQVRVHPTIKGIAYNEDGHEYWVIPAAQAIRPYGVCVYDVTRY